MSRFHRVLALILLCVPGLVGQTGLANANKDRAARKPKQYTIEQFMNSVKLGGASFSPDDKEIVFHSNQTGIYNVFSLPVTGGTPKQITNSTKESTFVIGFFPTDRRLLYTYDQGGNENDHIYVRELSGAERDLTPGEKIKATFAGWAKDRKGFYYQTNERDPKFMDLYRMEVEGYKRKLIFRNPSAFDLGAISGDEKWVALVKNNTTADTEIHLFSAASGEIKNITPAKKTETLYSAEDFNAESTHLYFTTNHGSEFTYVARYELGSGKIEPVEKFDWDVTATFFSWNGKYRVTTINEDARTKLRIIEQATGREVKLPDLPQGDITGIRISRSEKLAAFYLNGDRAPADLYVYDFQSGTANRLTHSLNPQIDAADLVEAEVTRFKSFDGLQIPNILFKPHQASASHKVPALVWVHGGPGGQTRKGYSAAFQFLANHGYVILGINNRGSSGYGQSFFTADDGKHGREPLWDCIEAKKYLQSLEYVDPDRIGIIGGSYGGYMVLAALAFRPEEFNVGVNIFGVANWIRTLESIPPYWESFRGALYKEIGNPATQKDFLREVSPLFHAHKIKRPLLVLQGANDPRVIKPESDDIVEAVKKNLVPVEYIVFEDEGHGFTKKVNEVKAWGSILEFLDKHLKTGSAQHAPRK